MSIPTRWRFLVHSTRNAHHSRCCCSSPGLMCLGRVNWFNQSEQYLAGCQSEAERRYYKSTSSKDVRHHIYLCMLAHGYAFKSGCDENGWLDPGCYRLKYKTEGR